VIAANLGYGLFLAGHLEEALEVLRAGVAQDPQSVACWNNLGTVLARRGARDEAAAAFERALALAPGDTRARANLEALRAAPPAVR
jgi:Flp pilus assembly protein TadD